MTTTTHEHHQKVKLAQVDGRGAVSPIPTYMKLTELVFFCYDDEQQLCVSLRFFLPNRDDHYHELSTSTARIVRPGTSFETHFRY